MRNFMFKYRVAGRSSLVRGFLLYIREVYDQSLSTITQLILHLTFKHLRGTCSQEINSLINIL